MHCHAAKMPSPGSSDVEASLSLLSFAADSSSVLETEAPSLPIAERLETDDSFSSMNEQSAISVSMSAETEEIAAVSPEQLQTTIISDSSVSSPTQLSPPAAAATRPFILSLTQDSLHCIASFLTPMEWCSFGQTSKVASKLFDETLRHVWLHGFRCAQEVVTAWKLGQFEDAKELAALYIASGVPIYPRSLGYSYQTLLWRMGVEAKIMLETEEQNEVDRSESDGASLSGLATDNLAKESCVDRFYQERTDFRARENYFRTMSYLSEKCLFWMDNLEGKDLSSRPTRPILGQQQTQVSSASSRTTNTTRKADGKGTTLQQKDFRPKLLVRIHQHLLDEHKNDRLWIDDQEGAMVTPPISLSAEFFHSASRCQSTGAVSITLPELELPDEAANESYLQGLRAMGVEEDDANNLLQIHNSFRIAADAGLNVSQFLAIPDRMQSSPAESSIYINRVRLNDLLSRVDLEIYSSARVSSKRQEAEGLHEMKRHLSSRFATYKRRLEAHLTQKDMISYDECILDFWDEFFPHSAGIHYYDGQTVVPRISKLSKFLTKPLPKAFGIIQCEIERIATTKGRGVSMKGRFFPTYEYRLFIRHRPHQSEQSENPSEDDGDPPIRRDTVLMVAKNRGRNYTESTMIPISAAARKGSNNYYLYMPQQSDVDAHFNKVNELERPAKMNPNGASQLPVILSEESYSSLLGRLQSNFIGTEFQIFTPRVSKRPRRTTIHDYASFAPCSEDELESEDGFSSDNNSMTAPRRSRFSRLSLRRTPSTNSQWPDVSLSAVSDASIIGATRGRSPSATREHGFRHRRSNSCPDVPHPRQARCSRRVANTPDWKTEEKNVYIHEEEDGCITYTANLLGSRPRIMDVCIPKIHPEANQCVEWKRYLDHSHDLDDQRMLNCFRQMLQRLENPSQLIGPVETAVVTGSDSYAPPEDFGLLPLQNRPPWWNVELGSFVLNFGGRVSVASVKNFQLCDRNDHDTILLQFGRIQGRHSFTMDFQYPLTAVQAFSIAISSLQSKISFA